LYVISTKRSYRHVYCYVIPHYNSLHTTWNNPYDSNRWTKFISNVEEQVLVYILSSTTKTS